VLGGTGNPIGQLDVLTDDISKFLLVVHAVHDMPRFQHPIVVQVEDYFGTKLGQCLVHVLDLLHSSLHPQTTEQKQVNGPQTLIADGGDILDADIVEFRVVVAKVSVRHFKAVVAAPGRVSVVNDANLHGVKIRKAAIADCPSFLNL